MKKIIAVLVLAMLIASSSHAFNIIEKLLYKKAVIKSNKTPILVNRITQEVTYIWRRDGKWVLLTGQWKGQYQKMYNAQDEIAPGAKLFHGMEG
jgi:hypothetical protein